MKRYKWNCVLLSPSSYQLTKFLHFQYLHITRHRPTLHDCKYCHLQVFVFLSLKMLPNSSVDFNDCHFSLLFCFNRTTIWSWNQTIHIALLLTSLFPQTKWNWFQKAFHLEYKPFSALSVLTSSLKPYNLTINHITVQGGKYDFQNTYCGIAPKQNYQIAFLK